MEDTMRFKVLACAAVAAFLMIPGARSQDSEVQFMPDDVKWKDYPFATGVQTSVLYGGPAKEGIYTFRVKMTKDAKLPVHTHPDSRMITVLSGELFAGRGTKPDGKNGRLYPPGGFFVVPAGTSHYVWAKNGDIMYQESGFGPSPTDLVKD
jgi:quercetin dioxygenase-like cupin family protein